MCDPIAKNITKGFMFAPPGTALVPPGSRREQAYGVLAERRARQS